MKINKIFFINIGNKSLGNLAQICVEKGINVFGISENKNAITEKLEKMKARIFYEHSINNIDTSFDFVIHNSVNLQDYPEILQARKLNLKIIKKSEFLKKLIKNTFKISIVGSHGKSTTTAIVGLALKYIDKKPDIYCGSFIKELNAYNKNGIGKISVIDAGGSHYSFHDLVGDVSIITSLEKSHLEYYKDEAEMVLTFRHFVEKHSDISPIIVNGDDMNIRRAIVPYQNTKKIITYGFNSCNDYLIKSITLSNNKTVFSVYKDQNLIIKDLEIKIPGFYNVLNFTALVVLFNEFNFDFKGIVKVAEIFRGIGRRFEISKSPDGKIFVDDFAYHPTQVRNLFNGLKQFYPKHKICAVFQPKQFHLIKNFLREFGSSFKLADDIILTEIFPNSGDIPSNLNSLKSVDLVNSIKCYSGKRPQIKQRFEDIANYIKRNFSKDTIVATIGVGDIYKIRDLYFKKFKFN